MTNIYKQMNNGLKMYYDPFMFSKFYIPTYYI